MIHILVENIQRHLSLLDLGLSSSNLILTYAKSGKIDSLTTETENRERLISVISKIQQTIEDQINQLNAASLTSDDIEVLKLWFQDLSSWSEKVLAIDEKIVEVLAAEKESTQKEIALIFRNKELFKGYNHSLKK